MSVLPPPPLVSLSRQDSAPLTGRPSLAPLLLPSTMAIVGASDRLGSVGHLTLAAARRTFSGPVYAINQTRPELLGERAFPSLSALPAVPDLVILAVPAPAAVLVARECVELGVGGLVMFSSGFAETGNAGSHLQSELAAILAGSKTRMLGPNSLGFFDAGRGTLATFLFSTSSPVPKPGPLALVSQSGGFAEQLVARAEQAGLGMTWMLSTGNELDVSLTEGFEFLLDRDEAETIVLFAESVKEPHRFTACARRAQELGKPVIVIKTGRSAAGARAAVTHTASMSGSDRVFSQACRDLGLVRVDTLDAVVDAARVLASRRRARGRRLAIVTASGGGGVLAADLAEDTGLEVPLLPAEVQDRLREMIPVFGTASNPIDVTAQGADDPQSFGAVLDVVTGSGEIDLMACVFSTHGPVAVEVARTIVAAYRRSAMPTVAVWGSPEEASQRIFEDAGLPYFGNPRSALEALAAVTRSQGAETSANGATTSFTASTHQAADCPVCRQPERDGLILESEAQAFLAMYEIRSARGRSVTSAEQAEAAVAELGFPVAMKLVSPAVPHREQAGAITLDVSSVERVREQFARLGALLGPGEQEWSVLVQQQISRGLEIVVGAQRDPDWGAIVLVGIGGTQAELINRSALRLVPVGSGAAHAAVREVFGHHVTDGATSWVADTVQRVSQAMVEHPQIDSIDINPLILTPAGLVAVDGLISVRNLQHAQQH